MKEAVKNNMPGMQSVYLNDVKKEDGGSTDFDYYKIKVNPERGKTLIWPAEWTHAHKGNIINSGSKYIITKWWRSWSLI
mgnify:CR=1 FL=1